MVHNTRIDVPDSIFLSHWWEILMRAVFFLLGMTYSSYFGETLNVNTYIGLPLLLIAFAIMMGRHAAIKKKKQHEHEKQIAEIVALERAAQLAESIRATHKESA